MPVYLEELALSVARCDELSAANDPETGHGHPCHKIVRSQDANKGPVQVPEAWAGNLEAARVVFLSSNPAISVGNPNAKWASKKYAEKYPTVDWADSDIADFMVNRFDSEHGWVVGRRHRKVDSAAVDGSPAYGSPEPYWGWVEKQTKSLLGPDVDWYDAAVMTEVVHCKSNNEYGVPEAALRCSTSHMGRILELSSAGLVVVVGGQAANAFRVAYAEPLGSKPNFGKHSLNGLPDANHNVFQLQIGGRTRLVCFVKHPGARGGSAMLETQYPDDIERIRNAARGQR
ncbi:hypothetical protein ACVWYS_002848 [Arthrobacter sp. TE12231]